MRQQTTKDTKRETVCLFPFVSFVVIVYSS